MLLPSACLHFGPLQPQTVTAGTSHYLDQADKAEKLSQWVQQQEKILRTMYGEEVEIFLSPLMMEEIEEFSDEFEWAFSGYKLGRNHSTPAPPPQAIPSSRRRRPHRKRSTPAAAPTDACTAAANEPSSPAAAPADQSTTVAATAEPPTPSTEINQIFVPVTYSPYSLEFMARVLRRGKVLMDLAIHFLSSHGSPEQTLEALSQLRDWKAEWGHYSPSSLTMEIIEAEQQRIIKETNTPAYVFSLATGRHTPRLATGRQTPRLATGCQSSS
ncbi:hypothetical protein ATANTOWER_001660 [Ataeniobius toweri]|uniref:Uncharacterized protein n=1 Tax=Ataeniobius toweri TaxID=208326 RepID=A0ABU7CDZ1_9TELE|nr:hypothetical protein [Ataeniobius toweri]